MKAKKYIVPSLVIIALAVLVLVVIVLFWYRLSRAPVPSKGPAAPSTAAQQIVWKAQSSYPVGLPQLYAPADHFAKHIEQLTNGRLVIKMHPGGAIVPALKVFDAVSSGTMDMGCTWAGWWIGKFPSAALFGNSYPNGMQTREMLGWIYAGGGLELWNNLYEGQNIVVLPPYGILGSENFCWSRKPINTLDDFKGLKFRTVGIWGKCLERLGARVVSLPGQRSILHWRGAS